MARESDSLSVDADFADEAIEVVKAGGYMWLSQGLSLVLRATPQAHWHARRRPAPLRRLLLRQVQRCPRRGRQWCFVLNKNALSGAI